MRIPSGVTDQVVYFVAVDATDLKTRETTLGSSGWTVHRSRNGAAVAAYTGPTVAESSSGNMPGVYTLLLDEDTTVAAGNDAEEYVIHISRADVVTADVTRTIELYRPETTAGQTLTVTTGVGSADALQINSSTGAATQLALSAATIATGTVDDTAFAMTTTEFEADDISTAAADHYNGRIIIFTSGTLQNQATDITDYALTGGRGHFTVTALTSAPVNNVTFVIV